MGTLSGNSKTDGKKIRKKTSPAAMALMGVLMLTVCLYLARLEAHTGADIFLPTDYHSILEADGTQASDASPEDLNAAYQAYVHQEGRPYTIRQDLLLSRLAYINAPQGFRGETRGVTVQHLCDEIGRLLGDTTMDAEQVLGRPREELLGITAGITAQSQLSGLEIRECFSYPSGLTGYVLEGNGEITVAFRGTDDAIDMLDNALLLPFNLSVQYAQIRELLGTYDEAKQIWLTGHSKGGHNAIYAASIDPRCKATAFNAPGFGIFLSDAQHDGLDSGVNYVINGDVTGFLLFHLERRVVLESTGPAAGSGFSFTSRHRLDHFFLVDDLTAATQIQPLSVWSEWITQILWLLLLFLAAFGAAKLVRRIVRGVCQMLQPGGG